MIRTQSNLYLLAPLPAAFQSRYAVYLAAVAGLTLVLNQTADAQSSDTFLPPMATSSQASNDLTKPAFINGYAEQLKSKRQVGSKLLTQTQPYAPVKKPTDEGQIPEIEMFIGESRVMPAPGVGRIAVGNGAILTAAALDGKEVILFANAVGTSSLFIWNEDGRYQRVKINIVPGDTSRYAREIAAFLTTIPKAKASVIGDKVIVEGDALNDADLSRIELLSTRYPQIVNFTNRLGFEQMVMLDVKVVEFPTTELRELGLKWGTTGGVALGGIWSPLRRGDNSAYQINLQTGQTNAAPITGAAGAPLALTNGLNVLSVVNLGLNATLNALAQQGKTTILAEPQLSARNGSKASFLAGGEFPYTVSTINGPTIQFKPYGVKLEVVPRVDRSGNIRATIDTEVSNIDNSVTTNAGPALLTRKTSTEFNVRNGETIVLSGLIQRENSTNVEKVPGLGDIPIIGALFRSKKFQNKETELVVFVTPTVIDSKSPGVVDRIQKTNEKLQDRLGPQPFISDPLQPGVDPSRLDNPVTSPVATKAVVTGQAVLPAQIQDARAIAIEPLSNSDLAPVSFDRPQGSSLRVKQDGLVLFAAPSGQSEMLLQLGAGSVVTLRSGSLQSTEAALWVPVQVGEITGWVAKQAVEPSKLQPLVKLYVPKTNQKTDSNANFSLGATLPKPVERDLTLAGVAAQGRYAVLMNRLALRITPDVNASILQNLSQGQVVLGLSLSSRGGWTAIDAGGKRGWVATQWLQPVSSSSANQ